MVKSFDELCRDFVRGDSAEGGRTVTVHQTISGKEAPTNPAEMRRRMRIRVVSDIIFYSCLVILLVGTFIYTQQGTDSPGIMGYKYYQVLTDSMKSVYPRGSIVFVKTGEIENIEVGDDMTFMVSATDTATHRCIEIIDNYEDTGMRAYRTQGVDNPGPDPNVTYENNVIGEVVGSIPKVGAIMSLISEYKIFILIFFVAMMVFSMAIRVYLKEVKAEKEEKAIRTASAPPSGSAKKKRDKTSKAEKKGPSSLAERFKKKTKQAS